MSDLVTIDVQDHVADVRLNRPEKYNALSTEMFQAIINAGEQLVENRDVRVVVLSGNGRGFCAGLDMKSFQKMDSTSNKGSGKNKEAGKAKGVDLVSRDDRPENFVQRSAMIWKRVPVPVIGALHGVIFGAGAQIALGADIRIAAPDIRLSIFEIHWGLIPDIGITQTLRDIVPLDVAKELTFTGRILDGATAKELGLVTHVSENPLDHAMELAGEIASKSPEAIRFGKKLFEESWHADTRTGLLLESELQSKLIGSKNQIETIRAKSEEREPQYKNVK